MGVGDGDAMSLRNACYIVGGGVTEQDCLQANIPFKQHAASAATAAASAAASAFGPNNTWSPFVFVEHVREVQRVLQRYDALVAKYKDARANKRKENEKENQARNELLRKLSDAAAVAEQR